jgi:hypothetical protein
LRFNDVVNSQGAGIEAIRGMRHERFCAFMADPKEIKMARAPAPVGWGTSPSATAQRHVILLPTFGLSTKAQNLCGASRNLPPAPPTPTETARQTLQVFVGAA